MKRWKKRILGFLLCAVLAGSMVVPVMALDETDALAAADDEAQVAAEEIGVTVSPEEVTLHVIGQTQQLHAEVVPSEMENPEVTWATNNERVATVDKNGLVTAVGEGTAKITASLTHEGVTHTAECVVTVAPYNGGIYQDPDSGNWYYYKNGTVDTSVTDVIKDTIGTIGTKGAWWNVVNGKVTPGETVAKNSSGWWYINANGMVDFNYTGFAKNGNGSWYCENGKVNFNVNSVLKDTAGKIGDAGTWWYVVGSQVQTGYTGLANYKNASGWWYIESGKVTFTANTVAKNKNGWYYVNNSKVDFSYTGLAQNNYGKWYVRNGTVTFDQNGVFKDAVGAIGNAGAWWYVTGSKVQTGYTGLANYKNANGWWYIQNGQVDFTHNGVDKNKNGWFYVTGGKVQFGYTGLANYSNANGWWYITNGAVDFTHSGVDKNNYGWWYVSGGKVNFSFTGIASNSNGMWLIQNGKVNFSYNGEYTYSGTPYTVKNGKATVSLQGMSTSMYNKAQSQSSATNWLIMIDVDNCKLGVFQGSKGNWTVVKHWTCSTGASGTPTVRGTYSITSKGKSFGDGFTCWYYSQFHGNYLIHSILYNPGSMTSVQDNRLGQHVSHGCVRLALENAKWIYDNVPIATRVVTY